METNQEQNIDKSTQRKSERGNALVYVLIAIALFAALSFTLGRQTDTNEAGALSSEKAELLAAQLISYAAQAKSVYDQMEFSGARIGNIDFVRPTDPGDFNDNSVANNINKIYHPEGGGLNYGVLPDAVIDSGNIGAGFPDAGWYMNRFNDVDWSTPDPDIILVAYGISQPVCAAINDKINGSTTIPTITEDLHEVFVSENYSWNGGTATNWTTGTQIDPFTTGTGNICVECENIASLCVQGNSGVYGFYSVIAER